MLKNIGRIIMLAAAGLFIVFAVITIIQVCIPDLKALVPEGTKFSIEFIFSLFKKFGEASVQATLVKFGWQILYIIIGLSALIVALKGKAGFWTTIAALIMLGVFIWQTVVQVKANPSFYKSKENILQLLKDIANYAVYVVGIIILKISYHKDQSDLKAYRKAKKAGKI